MGERKSFKERAGFWRILLAEQIRQFFAIPFKAILFGAIILFQASSWITQAQWLSIVAGIAFWYLAIDIVINLTRIILIRYYLRRKALASDTKDNFTIGMKRLSLVVSHVVFFFVFLHLIGVAIVEFFTSISLFAVALVLLFRDYIANFINGVMILFTDDLVIGNYIEVSGMKGRVNDITLMHVELQTDAGDLIYVPNSTLVSKEVINFSKRDNKVVSVEFILPKAALKQVITLEESIRKTLQEVFPDVINHEKVRFVAEKVEKDAVAFAVKVPFTRYTRDRERDVKHTVSKVVIPILAKAK